MLTIIPQPDAFIDEKISMVKVTRKSDAIHQDTLTFWANHISLPRPYKFMTFVYDEPDLVKFIETVYHGSDTLQTIQDSFDLLYQTAKLPFWNIPKIPSNLQYHVHLAWKLVFSYSALFHIACMTTWTFGELVNYNNLQMIILFNAANFLYALPVLIYTLRYSKITWFTSIELLYTCLLASSFYSDKAIRRARSALGAVCLQQMLQVFDLPGIGLYDELLSTAFYMLVPLVISSSLMGLVILSIYQPFMTDPVSTMQTVFNQAVGWKFEGPMLKPELFESYIILFVLLLFKIYNIVLFLAGMVKALNSAIEKSVKNMNCIVARERIRFMIPYLSLYNRVIQRYLEIFQLRILIHKKEG